MADEQYKSIGAINIANNKRWSVAMTEKYIYIIEQYLGDHGQSWKAVKSRNGHPFMLRVNRLSRDGFQMLADLVIDNMDHSDVGF